MNNWQDIVIACGALIFAIALIPSVMGKDKPALATSAVTAVVLVVFAFTFATLSLWFSTAMNMLTASLWSTLAVQKYLQQKR